MKNKKILIFGGAGSLGTKLVNFYLPNNEIVVVSRDEAKHWKLRNSLSKKITTYICDARDEKRVEQILLKENPNVVIIAHALKHIDVCESQIDESVKTNIIGVSNIINSIEFLTLTKLETVLFVSTDKACMPVNVYGMCKSISEKKVLNTRKDKVKFVGVRYGNVLNSKGSILPLLMHMSEDPAIKQFTLTDPRMTRFAMTLQQAVMLINTAIQHGGSGDLWIPQLKSFYVKDLIEIFSRTYNKPIVVTGIRPGEKIHELMICEEESIKTNKHDEYYVYNFFNEPTRDSFELSSKDWVLEPEQIELMIEPYIKVEKEV